MIVTAIDLAARYSASCTLGPGLRVLGFDAPLMNPQLQWLDNVLDGFVLDRGILESGPKHEDSFLVVEDVPLSLPFTAKVKAALQLQGEIGAWMRQHGLLDRLFFVQPMIWQRHFEGVWRGKEAGALAAAERLGFTPPDFLTRHEALYRDLKGKARQDVRNALKKQSSDVVDAYLMSVWAQEMYAEHGTLELPNVIKYLAKWN